MESPVQNERYLRRLRRWRRRRRRQLQAIAVLPSLFTLGNLIAGFAAIHFASKPVSHDPNDIDGGSSLVIAGILIFIGMFFDAVDGYVARLTRSASELGGQLDTLADMVTFGVAPAYMTLRLVSQYYLGEGTTAVISPIHDDVFGRIFWAVAAIYVCCAALRLARFNVETGSGALDEHQMFRGLPTPGAAGCVVSLILLHQHRLAVVEYEWAAKVMGLGMAFILLLCALAMVSRMPYVHVINRYVRGHGSFSYIVKLAIILAIGSFNPHEMLAAGFTMYALSAPVRTAARMWSRWSAAPMGAGKSREARHGRL